MQRLGPYCLVIANIRAGPLIELAPSLSAVLAEGGTLILAGLLAPQADRVLAAYRAQGLRLADRIDNGQWPTLRLRKRNVMAWKRPSRIVAGRNREAPGFGSWSPPLASRSAKASPIRLAPPRPHFRNIDRRPGARPPPHRCGQPSHP